MIDVQCLDVVDASVFFYWIFSLYFYLVILPATHFQYEGDNTHSLYQWGSSVVTLGQEVG